MKKEVTIDNRKYKVKLNEFEQESDEEFNNLFMMKGLGSKERLIGLLKKVNSILNGTGVLLSHQENHGGFIILNCCSSFDKIFYRCSEEEDRENLESNMLIDDLRKLEQMNEESGEDSLLYEVVTEEGVVLKVENDRGRVEDEYKLLKFDVDVIVKIKEEYVNKFKEELRMEEEGEIRYNNMLCMAMIVKNAGEGFREVLKHNKKYIDRYVILDTGSTDQTVEIAREELKGIEGEIVEEPFINFRDSRNRCLELCGESCKYIVMLDDTYLLCNDVRKFLERVRGDIVSDSFSLYIDSADSEYSSNRIIKSKSGLRYIYKIHEVINPENNCNVIVPRKYGYIFDCRSEYMEKRTMDRKEYDIKILKEMIEEDSNDSRAYYYLGQTYNLLGRYEEALECFLKRVDHKNEGFLQEKIDACFEAARLCNFQLKREWSECEKLYLDAYRMDITRPDSLYFVGIHYFLEKEYEKSYLYLKEAFHVGYPEHCQYSLKPTLSFFYVPRYLCQVCYLMNDYVLGEEVSRYSMEKNSEVYGGISKRMLEVEVYTMSRWNRIFAEMGKKVIVGRDVKEIKKTIVFVVDGGFKRWSGRSLYEEGVGGSETHVIEMSRCLVRRGFRVVVFCHSKEEGEEEVDGVLYRRFEGYIDYLEKTSVESVIVSRYPEYLGRIYNMKKVKEVVLILHDMIPEGEVILRHKKLKAIVLLSEFHKRVFDSMYSSLSDITEVVGYGIRSVMGEEEVKKKWKEKGEGYVFMFSSMANRGLLNLLLMWREVLKNFSGSRLLIHSDLDNEWLNRINKEEMLEIKRLVYELRDEGVEYRGWVGKEELYNSWRESHVWLYCTDFLETYCLTALEASMFGCLCITRKKGSLETTVGDRGYVLRGSGGEEEVKEVIEILRGEREEMLGKVLKNYEWSRGETWEKRCDEFLMKV